ncbi:hypothetical protein FITA111629_12865 [Filibacter tadaridae]|uniref:Uncharacterized protein n=1 Tax=Filibacter tadaridae TaxID=2483811 RepID=A0A3P5X8T7_9BACL|nr:hypothetical protein [Filibacter tadaridae]VDC24807.1 hypothetical protein FILTAD_01098 [Filibacter tadaridae]
MGKKKNPGPRRKRMKREQRLLNAKTKWLPNTTAKNIAKSYSKWYGVDLQCAIRELETIGLYFSDEYKKQVVIAYENKIASKQKRKEEREA